MAPDAVRHRFFPLCVSKTTKTDKAERSFKLVETPHDDSLTLVGLLNLANEGYPDGFLSEYYDAETGKHRNGDGDTLAKFIVIELRDNFDPEATREDQIEEAHRVLNNAIDDIEHVIRALE